MKFEMNLDDFLNEAKLTKAEWEKSNANWDSLCAIATDYETQKQALTSAAEQISSRIRTFDGVHSVRWRIKDTTHLLKKIIRKKLEENPKPKWLEIDQSNYLEAVTDLIGVRALHLFKSQCIDIDSAIQQTWSLDEDVVIYIRKGDTPNGTIIERGGKAEEHKEGYRSIHYIVKTQPEKKTLKAEIQVRTIFQEGWSEIDHQVRYPDHSDNEHVKVYLGIFNALAGNADEMGSFVQNLTQFLDIYQEDNNRKIEEINRVTSEHEKVVNEWIKKHKVANSKNDEALSIIKTLKEHIKELQATQTEQSMPDWMLARLGMASIPKYEPFPNPTTQSFIASLSLPTMYQQENNDFLQTEPLNLSWMRKDDKNNKT